MKPNTRRAALVGLFVTAVAATALTVVTPALAGHQARLDPPLPPAMARMHQQMANTGMARMHELMQQNSGMERMHELMMQGTAPTNAGHR
jgi:hypothetical protein